MSDKRFVRLKPDPKDKGWRLRIDHEEHELTLFAQEKVLPERANNPNANRVLESIGSHWFTHEDIAWLHEVTGELLEVFKKEAEDE